MKTENKKVRTLFCSIDRLGDVLEAERRWIQVMELEEGSPNVGVIGRRQEGEANALNRFEHRVLGHSSINSDSCSLKIAKKKSE